MSEIQIRTFENPWGGLNFSKRGGGAKNKTKMSKIQIRTFENPWGGSQNCLNYKLLSDPILKKKN